MSKYCAAVVHPDCENEPYCGAPMPCAKHAKREPVPLSDEEIAHRKEAATEMLASWRAERPVSSHASDVKDASVLRYEDELRYLATIDHLTKQLAEAEQRLRDNVGPRSLARIADLERQLAAECIAKTVARRQLAERDQQLAESHGRADKLAKALGIYGNHDQTVYCPAAFNPHNDCACGFTLTLLLAERTKG